MCRGGGRNQEGQGALTIQIHGPREKRTDGGAVAGGFILQKGED